MANSSDFDFSKYDFPEDRIWIEIPTSEMLIKIFTFVPIILMGLFGNYIIIRLIVLNRSLRTPTNLIIANMAVADFLLLFISPAMFMINDFYQNYQMGPVGCKIEGFLVGVFLITAVLSLSVVSYDRLTAIVFPADTRLTMFGVKFAIAVTWLAGFVLALPLALYRTFKVRQWKNFKEIYCKENNMILPKYWYFLITIIVWLPLGLMLICYSAIFYKLDRYERRNLNREHPLSISYKKTVAKTLFIVVIIFVILRLPFTIMIILRNHLTNNSTNMLDTSLSIVWYISQYLMFFNAAVNPFIYGFNNDNFRRAYAQTPICQCCLQKQQQQRQPTEANQQQQISKGNEQKSCVRCTFMRIFCCECWNAKKDFSVVRSNCAYTSKVSENFAITQNDVHGEQRNNGNEGHTNENPIIADGFI